MMTRDTHRAGEEVSKIQSELIGEEIMSCKETLASSSHAFTFSGAGLPDMADVNYRVFLDGETASRITVDESTIATTGFTILNGASAEVAHIMVQGKVAGRNQV
jgi:hypothetical protein